MCGFWGFVVVVVVGVCVCFHQHMCNVQFGLASMQYLIQEGNYCLAMFQFMFLN